VRESDLDADPRYLRYRAAIHSHFWQNLSFRALVQEFSKSFARRKAESATNDNASSPWAEQHLYFVEEAAKFACLVDRGYSLLIYPGSLRAFHDIAEGRYPGLPEALIRLRWLSLHFKKRGI
jgi:hypothetical protein